MTTARRSEPGAELPAELTAVAAARRVARLFPEVYRRYHWANRVRGGELPMTRRALEVLQHLSASGPLTVGEQAEHLGLRRNSVSELLQGFRRGPTGHWQVEQYALKNGGLSVVQVILNPDRARVESSQQNAD